MPEGRRIENRKKSHAREDPQVICEIGGRNAETDTHEKISDIYDRFTKGHEGMEQVVPVCHDHKALKGHTVFG